MLIRVNVCFKTSVKFPQVSVALQKNRGIWTLLLPPLFEPIHSSSLVRSIHVLLILPNWSLYRLLVISYSGSFVLFSSKFFLSH